MSRFRVYGAALAAIAVLVALALAEAVTRKVDALPLLSWRLPVVAARAASRSSRDHADEQYLARVQLASGVDASWYRLNPPVIAAIRPSDAVSRRYERYRDVDPTVAFLVWNRRYLRERLCSPDTAPTFNQYDDFFVFDPPTDTIYPAYRHLPRTQVPGWFSTNQFGWRGPDVALNKPANTIRIAFLGSSKTIDPYGAPFSHIEYIGEWLNLWMRARNLPYRVEVINTARTGISESSIAAILIDELLPLEPDLVVDDGGNDFVPGLLIHPPPSAPPRPARASGESKAWRTDAHSALSRRVHAATIRLRHLDGREPRKPVYPVEWPADVDEFRPDATHRPLPMDLHVLVGYYDRMRTALQAQGGQLALPSWVVMVRDGLTLTLPRDLTLFNALNWSYYPLSYAQLRRAADFDNRVFQAYARQYNLPFFDIAAVFPLDQALFGDALHKTPAGLRLESWQYLQMLASWLDQQIATGHLPRPMRQARTVHPALGRGEYPLVARAAIQRTCS